MLVAMNFLFWKQSRSNATETLERPLEVVEAKLTVAAADTEAEAVAVVGTVATAAVEEIKDAATTVVGVEDTADARTDFPTMKIEVVTEMAMLNVTIEEAVEATAGTIIVAAVVETMAGKVSGAPVRQGWPVTWIESLCDATDEVLFVTQIPRQQQSQKYGHVKVVTKNE
jgi:hypothetical protein